MGFFNNKNNNLEPNKNKSFIEWASENNSIIHNHLFHSGLEFINNQAENLSSPISNLILDDRWHYIDKAKKQSYRGQIQTNSDGIPFLNLVYYTYRHGGFSAKFNCKQILKELWLKAKEGRGINIISLPTKKPVVAINQPEINWVERDLKLWTSLKAKGESHYLKRKGLDKSPLPGIRYGKDYIAAQLIDTNNQFFGLQKIYNNGDKRFTKGLFKKGHFALIGLDELPNKLSTIHVCEGIATAATIHLATGEPVFVALDAFNLLPVCRALKRHFSKTPMLIWADNDWQKANQLTKFGKPLGNTGLIHAHRTAFKCRNALVCAPDFSKFELQKIKTATDFNDLFLLSGLDAVSKTTPVQPDFSYALTPDLEKFNKRTHAVISPKNFKHARKIKYNCRYLPTNIIKTEGVHLVRSAIGTGKTEVVEKLIKQHPDKSVLFTTHLISLVESAAKRLDVVSYNECDNFDLQIESRLAICLNSLGKLTAEGALRTYDFVIIDEIEQVLARLTTKIEQKPLVFSVLKQIMQQAKTLICLDAHLSKTTTQMIQRFCPDKEITIHFNDWGIQQSREIILHDSGESVQMKAISTLEQGKTVYLAFNSKKEAAKTYSTFKATFPNKKGLYISSDNTGDEENKAFFNNVNAVSKQYDYLICTPSVSTGVSIDNGHFNFVGGIFLSHVNTANDCMQALGRVRNQQTLDVYCEKRHGNKSLNPEVIASKWNTTHQHDLELMNLNALGQRIIMNEDYENLCLIVTQSKHLSFNDFYTQFALLALHEGMTLKYFEHQLDLDTQKKLRQLKHSCFSSEEILISENPLSLTAREIIALENKSRRTMNETRLYKKQQLIEFYNLSEKDQEGIQLLAEIDDDGRLKNKF